MPISSEDILAFPDGWGETGTAGSGSNAVVCIYKHKTTGAKLALKKPLGEYLEPEIKNLRDEAKLFAAIDYFPRIVRFLGLKEDFPQEGQCSLLLEYCEEGALCDFREMLARHYGEEGIPEVAIILLMVQLTQVAAYLHEGYGSAQDTWRPIVHRDIKPGNVLVSHVESELGISFKLADFGQAGFYDPSGPLTYGGTYDWQPPEWPDSPDALDGWKATPAQKWRATPASDVWSIGALVHYMALGWAPVFGQKEYFDKLRAEHAAASPGTSYEPEFDETDCDRHLPRRVTPINAPVDVAESTLAQWDDPNPNPKYSDWLNGWMMRMLEFNPNRRVTSAQLVREMVPEAIDRIRQLEGEEGLVDVLLGWEEAEKEKTRVLIYPFPERDANDEEDKEGEAAKENSPGHQHDEERVQ